MNTAAKDLILGFFTGLRHVKLVWCHYYLWSWSSYRHLTHFPFGCNVAKVTCLFFPFCQWPAREGTMVYNYRLSLLLLVWPEIDAQLPQRSWLGSCVYWLSNPVRESLKFIVSRITILERVRRKNSQRKTYLTSPRVTSGVIKYVRRQFGVRVSACCSDKYDERSYWRPHSLALLLWCEWAMENIPMISILPTAFPFSLLTSLFVCFMDCHNSDTDTDYFWDCILFPPALQQKH